MLSLPTCPSCSPARRSRPPACGTAAAARSIQTLRAALPAAARAAAPRPTVARRGSTPGLCAGQPSALLPCVARRAAVAHRRDVMLVASLPLPLAEPAPPRGEEAQSALVLDETGLPAPSAPARATGSAARLQLAYPWIATEAAGGSRGRASARRPFAGALARAALTSGAFAAPRYFVAGSPVVPELGTAPTSAPGQPAARPTGSATGSHSSAHPTADPAVSDATMSDDPAWRAGGVSRLMG